VSPRRPTRTVPTVLLPGAGVGHGGQWQSWLADHLTDAGRIVVSPKPAGHILTDRVAALRACLADFPDDGFDVVAHSVTCLLWLHHAATLADSPDGPRPARVALVAPPSPEQPMPPFESFYPVPLNIDAVRQAADGTVLVGGDQDPLCPEGVATAYGAPLKMATTVIPGAGHIDADAGFGPWPAVLDWCGRDNLAFIA